MSNILFQNALLKKNLSTPPIWFMRQAGRYHSHYQGLRKKYSFMELCKIPEVAAEVALGPVLDFDFDVSILFSDLLFPLEVLGMGLEYTEQGPRLGFQLNSETLKKLKPVEQVWEDLLFQQQALKCTRQVLPKNKSLIGFVGGVWTLFVYAVEGGHSGSLIQSKNNLVLMNSFFDLMISLLEKNIQLQLDGGAEVVMIFDTAAGEVSPLFFKKWIAPRMLGLAQKFPDRLGYYSKGTQATFFDQEFFQAPWVGMGFDHRWDLGEVLKGEKTPGFVQGNFDQALLFADQDNFRKHLESYVLRMKELSPSQRSSWVSGLGHGVLPQTPEANVRLFIEKIRKEFS